MAPQERPDTVGLMLKKVFLLAIAAAIVIAFRKAVADKGGTYDPGAH